MWRIQPTVYRLTLPAYEVAGVIAAAHWVAEGSQNSLPEDAVANLRLQVLANYDRALAGVDLDGRSAAESGGWWATLDSNQ